MMLIATASKANFESIMQMAWSFHNITTPKDKFEREPMLSEMPYQPIMLLAEHEQNNTTAKNIYVYTYHSIVKLRMRSSAGSNLKKKEKAPNIKRKIAIILLLIFFLPDELGSLYI